MQIAKNATTNNGNGNDNDDDDFRRRYEKEWPLPEGHEERQVVYNVYHILNHHVLFGGMYMTQAQRMMEQILRL